MSRLAGPRADLVQRYRGTILAALVGLMVLWGAASLAGLGPLGAVSAPNDAPMLMEGMPGMDGMPPVQPTPSMEETGGPLELLAMVAIAAYAIAAWRYLAIHRERGSMMPLAIGAAFALLAEATVAVVLSHNWEMTWWAWHRLMLVAFATIALGARVSSAAVGPWRPRSGVCIRTRHRPHRSLARRCHRERCRGACEQQVDRRRSRSPPA